MQYRIPIYKPVLGQLEIDQLADCVNTNWLSGGPKVKEFERRIAELCKVKHAIACNNGTVALYMALVAMEMPIGAKVIVPDFTFIASANAVVWAGGEPVFVDVDRKTGNIAIKCAEKAARDRAWGIMPVHIYGQAVNMDSLVSLAQKYELKVIEDACQGIEVSWQGKPVGSFGNASAMSFYADKTVTTGEGGMVLADSDDIAEKCLILKHQGRTGRGWYVHDKFGVNFRMTDLQAGVGLAQLDKLASIIQRKKQHEAQYDAELVLAKGVKLPWVDERGFNVPFRHNIFVDNPDALIIHLAEKGIEAKRVFYPLHRQPCYNRSQCCTNSDWLYEHGVSLPSSPLLTGGEIEEVCTAVREFCK